MIRAHLKKRNIAVLVYLAGMVAIVVRSKVLGFTEDDWLSIVLLFGTAGALIAACAFYLQAKKRTRGWLLLLPLNGLALLVYWLLADHSNQPEEARCPSCGAANFPSDETCRLCHASLHAATQGGA